MRVASITFIASVFFTTISCGYKDASKTEETSDLAANLATAKPQGFVISELVVESGDSLCSSQFGARLNFLPRNKDFKPTTLVECYDYNRIRPTPAGTGISTRFTNANETSGLDFSSESLSEFCKTNNIEDLSIGLYAGNTMLNEDDEILGYHCRDSINPDAVTSAVVESLYSDDIAVDLRALKYFKNLDFLYLATNTFTHPEKFTLPKNIKGVSLLITDGDEKLRKELYSNLGKAMAQIEYLELSNETNHQGREVIDVGFLQHMGNVKMFESALPVSSLSSLNGNASIKMIDVAWSNDTVDISSMESLENFRYEANQKSNVNSDDRKDFEVRQQIYTEFK